MTLGDKEMDLLRRLIEAEDADRHFAPAFDEAVEELGLDRYWAALNLTTAGAVAATGTAWRGGSLIAEVMSVTPKGREMARETPGASTP